MAKNILGVIGGLGPMATAYFMMLVTDMTKASKDQEHIKSVVLMRPETPDRTGFILGNSNENPLPSLIKMEDDVCLLGAKVLAMPCITAHYFQKELIENLKTKDDVVLIDGITQTAIYLKENNITSCGIMATDGTINSKLFQNKFNEFGIKSITPNENDQKMVMSFIYDNVKAGKSVDVNEFNKVAKHLKDEGAQVILLGCTELSMIKKDNKLCSGVLDVLEVLAQKAVLLCGELKEEYKDLITR